MTNGAAIGYMILAAKDQGLDKSTIDALEKAMRRAIDQHSVYKAQEVYEMN